MIVFFSEEEKRWITKKPFNWSIKERCPNELKKRIKRKLDLCAKYKNELPQ